MKVFIRDTKNGWYYQAPSQWTPDQGLACDLKQVARAVEQIFEAHLEHVEILLSYDEPRYDLILPVPPSPSRADAAKERRRSDANQHGTENRPIPRKKGPL